MLHRASKLHGTLVQTIDGAGGTIEQFLFDDVTWTVRHVVVRVGRWLTGRRVLLPPDAITLASPGTRTVYVARTRAQIAVCADLCADPPVAEQHMQAAASRIPTYPFWYAPGLWSAGLYAATAGEDLDSNVTALRGDPHLRGTRYIAGYSVAARDATFGRIADVVLDDVSWTVYSVVVGIRLWPPRLVVIPRDVVRSFDWCTQLATVDMWRTTIEQSPDCRTVIQQQYAPRDPRAQRQPIG